MANLRNMGAGSDSYAAEWNDRQFTLLEDNIAQYADNADQAFPAYRTHTTASTTKASFWDGGTCGLASLLHPPVSTCISNGQSTAATRDSGHGATHCLLGRRLFLWGVLWLIPADQLPAMERLHSPSSTTRSTLPRRTTSFVEKSKSKAALTIQVNSVPTTPQ